MRGLDLPERTEDFSADPVELFFDLAFVFAFSQLVAILLHEPTWTGVGKAALIFLLLWLPWSQFTWSANAVSGNSRSVRLLFLVATAASVPMAAAVTSALDDGGVLFAVPLAVIFVTALAMMVSGLERGTSEYASSLRYAAPNMFAMALIVVGGFLDGSTRVTLWIIGIAIWFFATARSSRGDWIIRSGHFAERHGLIIIVALGEVVIALGNAVVVPLREHGEGLIGEAVIALVASGVFAGLLWWSYFDRVGPALEHRSTAMSDHDRGKFARDVYTYDHTFIVAGVILAAVALEVMALHPNESTPDAFRAMGAVGLALFYGGISVAVFRAFHAIAWERIAALAAVFVLMVLSSDVHGVWVLVGLDLILFVNLAVEQIRIERPHAPETAPIETVEDGWVDDEVVP